MTTLGTAYMQIVPSMADVGRDIRKTMESVAPEAGKALGGGMSKGMEASLSAISTGMQLKQWGAQISNVGAKLTAGITKPAAGAALAVGTITTALGFKRLMGIENAKKALEGLGYSAQDAAKVIDGPVLASVKGTAFGIQDAALAASGFIAGGLSDMGELERMLTITADMTAVGTAGFGHMAEIMQRVSAEGRVTGLDLKQMGQNGVFATAALSDALGVSQEEIRKLASQGQISADQLVDALEKQIGGSAQKMGDTLEGVLMNTGAAFGRLGEKVWGDVYPKIKESLESLITILDSPAMAQAAESLGTLLADTFEQIIDGIQMTIDWWNNLDGSTQRMIGTFAGVAFAAGPVLQVFGKLVSFGGTLATGFGQMGLTVGKLGAAFSGAAGTGGGLLKAVTGLLGPVGIAIGLFVGMVATSSELRGVLGTLLGAVANLVKSLAASLAPAFSSIIRLAGNVLSTLGDLAARIISALMPAVEGLFRGFEGVVNIIGPLIGFVADLASVFSTVLGPAIEIVMTLLEPVLWLLEKIFGFVGTVFGAIGDFVTGLFGGATDAVDEGMDEIEGRTASGLDTIEGQFGDAGLRTQATVGANGQAIVGIVGEYGDLAAGKIESVEQSINEFMAQYQDDREDGAAEHWGNMGDTSAEGLERIAEMIQAGMLNIEDIQHLTEAELLAIVEGGWADRADVAEDAILGQQHFRQQAEAQTIADLGEMWDSAVAIDEAGWLQTLGITEASSAERAAFIQAGLDKVLADTDTAWANMSVSDRQMWAEAEAVAAKGSAKRNAEWKRGQDEMARGLARANAEIVVDVEKMGADVTASHQSTAQTSNRWAQAMHQVQTSKAQQTKTEVVGFSRDTVTGVEKAYARRGFAHSSGAAVMREFAQGIISQKRAGVIAAQEAMAAIRAQFPSSPAKEGPFSGRGWVTYSGRAIMDGLADGVHDREHAFAAAVADAMRSGHDQIGGLGSSSSYGGYSSYSGPSTPSVGTVNINMDVSELEDVQSMTDFAKRLGVRLMMEGVA